MESYRVLYDSFFISFETWLLIIFAGNSLLCKTYAGVVYSSLLSLQIVRRILFGKLGPASLLLSLVLDVSVTGVFYSGTFRKKVFLIVVFYSINFIFDSAAFLITNVFYSNCTQMHFNRNQLLPVATIISKLMVLSVVLLIKESLKTGNNLKEWLKYLPTPVFTIVALVWGSPFTNDLNNGDIVKLLVMICIFGLLSNIYLIIYIQRTNEKAKLEHLLYMQKESERLSKDHYIELRQAYRHIDRLAHDIKHHLDYLESAADSDNVRNYIQNLKNRSFSQLLSFTANFDIDVILHTKNNELRDKGMILTVNHILPPKIEWLDPVDVSIILGNGLTNAMEACECCNGNEISVSFRYDDDWLLISIENPTIGYPVQKKNGIGIVSTKKGNHHGIGMENIAASIERYDGMMKYTVRDGKFILDILLQKIKESDG